MKSYTFNEVVAASLEYFNGDNLAAEVFANKYALQNNEGQYVELTPADMHRRLAREFARIEAKYPNPMNEDEIFTLFDKFQYVVPQGSPMSAIGNAYKVQSTSNCFVIASPADSYGGIMMTDEEEAQIMKRRGGVGFDLSTIRPKGLPTNNAANTTDGIGVFMERFSNTCREVAQGGRRGALMLSISVHHPEVLTFATIKRDKTKVTGANISVRLSDEFMEAVRSGTDYEVRWPVDAKKPKISKRINAREVWTTIIESAHGSAEPGLLFWDTAKKFTPSDAYADVGFGSTSTNPCGEIILSPYDSCRLLLMNLTGFVKNPFLPNASFDYEAFHEKTMKAQRLMDDMIDLEIEMIDKILVKLDVDPEMDDVKDHERKLWYKIRAACVNGRRTGLGVTALGDALAMLDIKYGSDKSVRVTGEIYKALAVASYSSSVVMAAERGAFGVFSHEKEANHPFIKKVIAACSYDIQDLYERTGRRNIANTTTAPAGSVSILTQTTSGIEPMFSPTALSLAPITRRRKINPDDKDVKVDFVDELGDSWTHYTVYHHGIMQWMKATGRTDVENSPYYGATSADIDWVKSVDLQAAAQAWVCHAISKTCNLPADVSVDVVKDVYMRAWETGCKGFTVYRDGSRSGVLVAKEENKPSRPVFEQRNAPKRPAEMPCSIHSKIKVKGETWTILVGLMDDKPYEVFGGLSKYVEIPKRFKAGRLIKDGKKRDGASVYTLVCGDGEDEMVIKDVVNVFEDQNYPAFTRTISLALRHGTPVQYLVEQLQKDKYSDMQSFSRVVARVLKDYIPDGTAASDKKCQDCGAEDSVKYSEGCLMCTNCGSSKCG